MANTRRTLAVIFVPLVVVLLAASVFAFGRKTIQDSEAPASEAPASEAAAPAKVAPADSTLRKATFAGGCFWCVESAFQDLEGVQSAVSGFSGGSQPDPTYEEVSSGATDYTESVQVTYDPDQISYEQLLNAYWRDIDPTDAGGQFADRGSQYRPVIFYRNERQKRLAEQSKAALAESGRFDKPIVVPTEPFERFYAAKDYHQDYYKTHTKRYKQYFEASGRAPFLRRTWGSAKPTTAPIGATSSAGTPGASNDTRSGPNAAAPTAAPNGGADDDPWRNFEKPSKAVLKKQLTPMQYRVTQQDGTEPPFENKYWDNERAGIYVDIVSGEPLFSSKTKFHSGTGWPSFYKPLEPELVIEKEDRSGGMVRTEVRSKYADSHLGHVFKWSGKPEVPTGLRYCLDSAALRFIPKAKLAEAGYEEYTDLFE